MYYSKLQKFLSSLILFSMLGGLIFRVPFFDFNTFAGSTEFYDLVSIIVDEDSYDEIDGITENKLERYAKDIQGVLENTKVIILPTPTNASAFEIASLNESLFFEGYKSLDENINFESRLVGTILVGNFNLPVVFNKNESSKTILPFTDFEDKVYIYNHETNRYEKNDKNKNGLSSEIWHGVISPNTGNFDDDIDALKDYFDKNNDFYEGTGNFQLSNGILNGNKEEGVPDDYEPFVFYYDQFREEKALNYTSYRGYKGYLNNKEDLVYNRYTKKLADDINKLVSGEASNEITGMIENLDNKAAELGEESPFQGFDIDSLSGSLSESDMSQVPDIQTRHIINNLTNSYLEVFAGGILGDFRGDVNNAGRYNKTGGEINVDLIPYLVTVLDILNDEIIKEVNDELEGEIDDLVKNGLSRKIPILTDIKKIGDFGKYKELAYKNYYSGTKGEDITSANQCSVFRGQKRTIANKSQLVSATKTFNFTNTVQITEDIESIQKYTELKRGVFSNAIIGIDENLKARTMHLWGGNSILNIDTEGDPTSSGAIIAEAAAIKLAEDTPDVDEQIRLLNEMNDELKYLITVYEAHKVTIARLYNELDDLENDLINLENILTKYINLKDKGATCYYTYSFSQKCESGTESVCKTDNYCYTTMYTKVLSSNTDVNDKKIDIENKKDEIEKTGVEVIISGESVGLEGYPIASNDFQDTLSDLTVLFNNGNLCYDYTPEDCEDITCYETCKVGNEGVCDYSGDICSTTMEEQIGILGDEIDGAASVNGWTDELLDEAILKKEDDIESNNALILELQLPAEINSSEPATGDPYALYKTNKYSEFILPVYDIVGSVAVDYRPASDTQYLKQNISFQKNNTYSPLECLENDIITSSYNYSKSTPRFKKRNKGLTAKFVAMEKNYLNCDNNSFESLTNNSRHKKNAGKRYRRSKYKRIRTTYICNYLNDSPLASKDKTPYLFNENFNFEDIYLNIGSDAIYLNNVLKVGTSATGWEYYYKSVPSYIEHKSPNVDTLQKQINANVSKSLPIDKNRYIDFISATGDYNKIEYPALFRTRVGTGTVTTFETISDELDIILNSKTNEIDEILDNNDPNLLNGTEVFLYNLFKDVEYPDDSIDLLEFIKNQPDRTFTIEGEERTISYYDTLVSALYWNSLTSVSAKYAFIIDNYLVDQFGDEDSMHFLAKNKKQYEISYLGATGDAQNMYIKLDPEAKDANPYSDIISDNLNLDSKLLGLNVGGVNNEESLFECSPPDGVPIWEWIPAVMCRLEEIMPPSISISDGVCGPSLLTAEEKEEINECNGDVDKDGINDCIELKLEDGILELTSDSKKYFYNSNVLLQGIIKDKDGKVVTIANNTNIYFEVEQIEVAQDKTKELVNGNIEVVYDKEGLYNSDTSIFSDYITFTETEVKAQGGVAEYGMGLKSDDANIYLKAYLKINDNFGEEAIFIESDLLEIQIRGDRLFNTSFKLENKDGTLDINSGINSLYVNDKKNIFLADGFEKNIDDISQSINNSNLASEKLIIFLDNISSAGNTMPLSYPLIVNILEGDKVVETFEIENGDLNSYKSLIALEKSGSYSIEITDNDGFKTIKNIELLPEVPSYVDINLGTTIMESGGNISTNFVTIYDKYGNPSSGDFYNIDINIDGPILGDGVFFLDNEKNKLSTTTYEGYQIFRLKSTNREGVNDIKVSVSDMSGTELISSTHSGSSKELRVLKEINLIATLNDANIKVGGNSYSFNISLTNEDNEIISDFNSRVYLISDSIYMESINPYVDLINGEAVIDFKTTNLAGKDIGIEFQVEGLNKIINQSITIFPENPMQIDLILSDNKLEATPNSTSLLQVELKDRYNNIVFDDNSTKVKLEILDQYSHILSADSLIGTVVEGKGQFNLRATLNPGVANFKVSTIPSLILNSFTIKGQDEEDDMIIKGVGENVGKIETFYFWNDSKLKGKRYNSIYTTLLGSNYGNIYEKDYLAGSLLFEKDNRSLAVTSLLNNPFKYNNILNLNKNGGLQLVYSKQDLAQDIDISTTFIDNKLGFNLYNKALNIYIGKIFYDFDDDVSLISCGTEINDCIDPDNTSIVLKSVSNNHNVSINYDDNLVLSNIYGNNLFKIGEDGTFNKEVALEFEFDKENTSEYLVINIKSGGNVIAKLGINFVDANTSISRDEALFNTKIDTLSNSIGVLLKTYSYSTYDNGNTNNKIKTLYYNDPFDSENTLDVFSKNNLDGAENFVNKSGIGWKEGNKSLLAFSAGKTVGESVQDYMSFSVINLGDPVISLKKIKKKLPGTEDDRKFDSTIGKLLSTDDDIAGFHTFDYDNDGKSDILLIKDDNYFKLLENKDIEGGFLDKGNLAYIVDLGNLDLVNTGDFSGDGFDDIFFINKDGKPFLLNNDGDPFLLNNSKKDFTRYSLEEQFDLAGKIIRAKQFDMDNDGKSDIVTLDDAGEINIFYGGGTSSNPLFTKLLVSDGHGIQLNSDVRNDNALVYFDDLYEPEEVITENERIDNYLFIKYPYSNDDEEFDFKKVLNGDEELPTERGNTYFIKSEYSEFAGLKVEKTFEDKNGGFLSSGDIVKVNIKLINVSDNDLYNVAYLEKVNEIFKLDKKSIISNIDFNIESASLGYHFLLNGFDVFSEESLMFSYEAEVLPISYSYIDVGLFDEGNDLYGDIIIKDNNKNCSEPVDFFKSVGERNYNKDIKVPTCDEDKIELPPELEKNSIDLNGNGVPDYIDELSNTDDMGPLLDYATKELANMNTDADNDGVPDNEDFFEGTILDSLFTGTNEDGNIVIGGLGEDLQKLDGKLDNAQELLNSLNCSNSSCFALPLNWAPLAPGNDPVFMGMLIGDGLMVSEGLPVFSAMTNALPTFIGPLPFIWPPIPGGAGGRLGTAYPLNFFRLFITPTLTGGVGMAMCFGPPIVAGNLPPMGLSPIIPSGNCIVLAKTFMGCSGDGSDGDVASIGIPNYSSSEGGGFGIINGNCGNGQSVNEKANQDKEIFKNILVDLVDENDKLIVKYFNGIEAGINIANTEMSRLSEKLLKSDLFSDEPVPPLFTGGNGDEVGVELDLAALKDGDFGDVMKIQMPRISPFPDFLMGWVTRQIEEIVNKLTDFPTVFIILPDFTGIFNGAGGNAVDLINIDDNLANKNAIDGGVKKVNSGIKEAYEFIGSIPLLKIEQEIVNLTLPWISSAEINKKVIERSSTLEQRDTEIKRAKEDWNFGASCDYENLEEQKNCEEANAIGVKMNVDVFIDLDFLVEGLRKNIDVIKEYKEIPEKINNLMNKKQVYLEQILCNIDIISNILGGRIGKNGDRFKAWVELYILIKAILKSWQMLIDVFLDFDAECSECKNERGDALGFIFKLISFIIPKVPIIKFPKWPDIIIDLHSIRAGLTVALPQFNITTKPIMLPSLPNIYLPSVPYMDLTVDVSLSELLGLEEIPVLPRLEIPELPDIPSLPSISLPDLPPPPKLPKMLASIEIVLDILKLITKAMCILKSLPIVPEWRAGDHIAFLTERNGYLPTDYFDVSMPEYSYPFLDAIKVTTFVNLEFENDYITELARQIAMPLNKFSNDFTNIFDLRIPDLNLSNLIPTHIEGGITIGKDGIENNFKESLEEFNAELNNNINNVGSDLINDIGGIGDQLDDMGDDFDNNIDNLYYNPDEFKNILFKKGVEGIKELHTFISEGKDDVVSNLEFKKLVNNALSSKTVTSDPKLDKIRGVWNQVNNMTYSKENALIQELKDNNREKFEALKNIINTELIENKKLQKELKYIGDTSFIKKVGFNDNNKINLYNESLTKYNDKFKKSAEKLINISENNIQRELKESGDRLLSSITTPLSRYSNGLNRQNNERLLSAVTGTNTEVTSNTSEINSCQGQVNSDYRYNYEGLYILEEDVSYRLFDYLGEIDGNEITKIIDIDNDDDEDLLYFANKQLFLKENLENNPTKNNENTVLTVDINDNKFYNGDKEIFYEALNNVSEMGSDSGNINLGFSSPTNKKLNNFRIGFYDRVDKYLNEKDENYRPEYVKEEIIDAFAGIKDITKIAEENLNTIESQLYIERYNLAYIKKTGDLSFSGLTLETKNLIDIKNDTDNNKKVNLQIGETLYAGKDNFTMVYIKKDDTVRKTKVVKKFQNIEFLEEITIIGVTQSAYIEGTVDVTYKGSEINTFKYKPLFPGSKISYTGLNSEIISTSYIEIMYYDGSELGIDLRETKYWEIYDLGYMSTDYFVRINKNNDYYYTKMNVFKNNINGTLSNQILLAPQFEADVNAPILTMPAIKIPVYQEKIVDITNYLYEDSGLNGIEQVIIDLDLEVDTDGNGNNKDDDDGNLDGDYKDKVKVLRSSRALKLQFGKFNTLFERKIGITIIDSNYNSSYNEVNLEVYTPIPQITTYNNGLVSGIINEELTEEPIDLYRFRGGIITKLEESTGNSKAQTINGNYSFDVELQEGGLKLYSSSIRNESNVIASINEKTGKITFPQVSNLVTKVISSNNEMNDKVFPKIIIRDNGEEIFYEYIRMKGIDKVKYVNTFDGLDEKGIYFKFTNTSLYNYYSIPETLDYNPGTLSIYRVTDTNKDSLFTLFNDGRINTINFNYKLEYDNYEDYIIFKLIDGHFDREVGRVLFINDSEYIMK